MKMQTLVLAMLAIAPVFCVTSATAAACEAPEHRQFDFWIGHWNVSTPDGKTVGQNRIEREFGGCMLRERYTTERGYQGESFNVYDAGRRTWHQTWVDNGGLLLRLEGAFTNGAMVLAGETKDAQGKVTRHRITWTPNADGSVRQHWESSAGTDAQGGWATAFDGKYTRR